MKALAFKQVSPSPQVWDLELSKYADRTMFQTSAWVSFVAKTQNAEPVFAVLEDGDKTVGHFVGLIVQKFGVRILGSPFPGWTTSYMGLCLAAGISRSEAVRALLCFAFENLRCFHLEFMDRALIESDVIDLELEYRTVRSFEINLEKSEDGLFASLSPACRRCIRKAEKGGVSIEVASDNDFADEYHAQLKEVFAKQSLVPPYGPDRVRELIKHLQPTGMLLLLRAKDQAGSCIATGIFPAFNQMMYFWGGASWRAYQIYRPNELIQWYAIKYWKRRGMRRYDMGGGGEYKRKYGGSEIAVPWFHKSKYPTISSLRSLARKLFKARQSVRAKWDSSARYVL